MKVVICFFACSIRNCVCIWEQAGKAGFDWLQTVSFGSGGKTSVDHQTALRIGVQTR